MESLPPGGYLVHVEPAAFIPVAILSGIGIVMTSIFIAVNIKYRGYKLLKMTSPNLNLVMLSGSILLCISVVLFGSTSWLPESPSQEMFDIIWQINHAGVWLASVGFTLFFAPLAAKTWRVHRIFTDAAVKGRVIKDDRLLCFVALFVIFDFGYLALWFGIDAPKCHVVHLSQLPGFYSIAPSTVEEISEVSTISSSAVVTSLEHGISCVSKFTPLWVIILTSYKGSLLYYILYVAWATRYVTLPSMKDAGGLIISVFVTLTSFCITTPFVTSLQRWPNAQYVVMASAIFVPLFTVMCLHFIPKLVLIRRHNKHEVLTRSFAQYTTPKQPEFSDDEIRDLAIQNATLRKEVAEKQRRYKTVLEQLRVTKAKLLELSIMASDSTDMNTCASDDAFRSNFTESTGDMSSLETKKDKRKESLARELAHKVTRALILKSQENELKSDDVSISVTSSSDSPIPLENETQTAKLETTLLPDMVIVDPQLKPVTDDMPEQKDPDVPNKNELPDEAVKRTRHVSFNNMPTQRVPGDLAGSSASSPYKTYHGHVIPKPVIPVLGRNSWDYYTRGTGYMRYKANVLNQGSDGTIAAITGFPDSSTKSNGTHKGNDCPVKTKQYQSTPKLSETPRKGVEIKILNENPKQTKSSDFKYFSTSASSRSPSSSTDMTSSLGRSNDDTKISNNNIHSIYPNKSTSVKSGPGSSGDNDTDVPSTNSAFSVVTNKGKRPCTGSNDVTVTSPTRLPRIDDVGVTFEEYSSDSDSDEYDNATTSMDSITCELFPPLTPRHKHYLRRYDAMHAKYISQRHKYQKRYKKSRASEKSEGYSSGNEVGEHHVTISNDEVTKQSSALRKSNPNSFSQSYLNRDTKRKLLARASRKFEEGYLYDSITSTDSDSDSDWGNSDALKQCWERVAQKGQLPLLRAGPITFSHTRKDGIFV